MSFSASLRLPLYASRTKYRGGPELLASVLYPVYRADGLRLNVSYTLLARGDDVWTGIRVRQTRVFAGNIGLVSSYTNGNTIKNFSHPVSEFSLFVRKTSAVGTDYAKNWMDWQGLPKDTRYNGSYGGGGATKYASSVPLNQVQGSEYYDLAVESWQLSLNNHDRLPDQNDWGMLYYNQVQPFETHSRISPRKFFNYSFALRPENLLATGTLNCSRVDNIEFRFVFSAYMPAAVIYIFGRNFNVIKISSGLAGLRFSS
jgi:hypothetical protein